MRFQGGIPLTFWLWILVWAFSSLSWAKLDFGNEKQARELLARKLSRISRDLDMKEYSYKDSKGSSGKETNANDGNPFASNTTYHSYVWDYCTKWIGGRFCEQWMQPYVSLHGAHGDRSPLEAAVYTAWQSNKRPYNGEVPTAGTYGVWNIRAQGGSFLKDDGTLDREKMVEWRLTDGLKKDVEKIGTDTANRMIGLTFDEGASKNGEVMPNMESLRMMSGRWTKMLRNRLLANIGEIRAMQPGIEIALGEDIANCQDYERELQRNRARISADDRIDPQKELEFETKFRPLQERIAKCNAARAMNAYSATPRTQGNQLKSELKGEWIDAALSRASLATIDFVGTDPRSVPMDGRIVIRDEDTKARVTEYANGGKEAGKILESNWESIQKYNRMLKNAAVGYKEVAARTPFAVDRSKATEKWQIAKGSTNAVLLNDRTPEMKNETGAAETQEPGENLEVQPSQLVVRK